MNPAEIPAWLQAGGLLAFAAAVYMEQRAMRIAMQEQRSMLAAILEYARNPAVRRAPTNPVADE